MQQFKIEWQDLVTKSAIVEAKDEEEVRKLFAIGAYSEEPAIIEDYILNFGYKGEEDGLVVKEERK